MITAASPRNFDLVDAVSRAADAARDAAATVQQKLAHAGTAAHDLAAGAAGRVEQIVADRIKARVGPPIVGAITLAAIALLVALLALHRATRREPS